MNIKFLASAWKFAYNYSEVITFIAALAIIQISFHYFLFSFNRTFIFAPHFYDIFTLTSHNISIVN